MEMIEEREMAMKGAIKTIIIGVLLGTVLFGATPLVQAGNRPNFLFIIVDDLGWADVGVNNPDTFYETPNIDALAGRGLRFSNGYMAGALCSPSRASVMTGKTPARLQMTNWIGARQPERYIQNTPLRPAAYIPALPHKEVTIAETMRDAGYETYFLGKWHLGKDQKNWPEHHGFETNIGGCMWNAPIGPGKYFTPYGIPTLPDGPEGEHLPDRLAKETIAFLKRDHDRPFFTFLSFYSVHAPFVARADLEEKYLKKEKAADAWRPDRRTKFKTVQNNVTYAAMVEAMDVAVGDVLNALKTTGLDKDTVVFFVSDNGGVIKATSNEPLRAGKCYLYEGGIRVPFIVSWSGHVKAGRVTDVPVTSTDFYPTILELAGIPAIPEQHSDGVSFVPLLNGDETFQRGDLFWHFPHYAGTAGPVSAIRSGNWKLLHFYEDGRTELYDLSNDIGEHQNLSAQHPEKAEGLLRELNRWRKLSKAAEPDANPKFNPKMKWKPLIRNK